MPESTAKIEAPSPPSRLRALRRPLKILGVITLGLAVLAFGIGFLTGHYETYAVGGEHVNSDTGEMHVITAEESVHEGLVSGVFAAGIVMLFWLPVAGVGLLYAVFAHFVGPRGRRMALLGLIAAFAGLALWLR